MSCCRGGVPGLDPTTWRALGFRWLAAHLGVGGSRHGSKRTGIHTSAGKKKKKIEEREGEASDC